MKLNKFEESKDLVSYYDKETTKKKKMKGFVN